MKYSYLMTIALVIPGFACSGSEDSSRTGNADPQSGTTTAAVTAADVVQTVTRTDIVSDLPGAREIDPLLKNAWGLAFDPQGPAWVSSNGSGLSESYDSVGRHVYPTVTIPPCRALTSSPTGQVFNSSSGQFLGDQFIYVTEQGTIAGWQPALNTTAALRAGGAACGLTVPITDVYKGVAIAGGSGNQLLYAANFRAGTVDVFNSTYTRIIVPGNFADPDLPVGFAPFNVVAAGDALIVTYAKQDEEKEDDVAGPGNGFVDLFDLNGNLTTRLISGGELNSPWGFAAGPVVSPAGRAAFRVFVGNFGDGVINAYSVGATADQTVPTFQHEGVLGTPDGNPLIIDGLWALSFGNGAAGFRRDALYFTAGPVGETHGVFGRLEFPAITMVPAAPLLP